MINSGEENLRQPVLQSNSSESGPAVVSWESIKHVCILFIVQMMDFLAVLPSEQLARTAFKCQAYTRALRHIEDHIRSRPDSLSLHLTFMQVSNCNIIFDHYEGLNL